MPPPPEGAGDGFGAGAGGVARLAVQMSPPITVAASLVPSDDEVMENQLRPLAPVPVVWLVQCCPLSVEVEMSPP